MARRAEGRGDLMPHPIESTFHTGRSGERSAPDVLSFVHAADGPMRTVCGVALDDHMPPAQRLMRFYTDHPSFDDLWANQSRRCPGCTNEIVRRELERRNRGFLDAANRAKELAKRASEAPVWLALYAAAVVGYLEKCALRNVTKATFDARYSAAINALSDDPTIDDGYLLAHIEEIAARVTTEVVQAEHVRQGQALSAEWDKIVAEYPDEATRELVWKGFERATVACIGNVPGRDEKGS